MTQTVEQKREYQRKWMAAYRAKNKAKPLTEKQKEAARERCRRWRLRNPGKCTPYDPTHRMRRPWCRSLGVRQAHAKKAGLPFTLKVKDVEHLWTGRCAVTGIPFELVNTTGKRGPRAFSPSLDRIQPELGYVPGNVRFVLQCVNAFRGTMTDTEMKTVAEKILKPMLQ
jgi:hypothetical protein